MGPRIIFLVISVAFVTQPARSEHTVINGGGQGEQNVMYGLTNLDRFIRLCTALSNCRGGSDEAQALSDLLQHVPEIQSQNDAVQFAIPEEDSRLLDSNGLERPYYTTGHWGSSVIINRNLLYSIPSDGGPAVPASVADGVRLLTEIFLGQRATTLETSKITSLAARMARTSSGALEQVAIGHNRVWIPSGRLLRFSSWTYPRPTLDGYFSELTIQDAEGTHILTEKLHAILRCENPELHPSEHIIIRGLSVTRETSIGGVQGEVRGEAIFSCVASTGSSSPESGPHLQRFAIEASFGGAETAGDFVLLDADISALPRLVARPNSHQFAEKE